MIIANQKKKENIAEYLLYMYQVEDLIRANEFDLQRIEQTIVNKFEATYDTKREMLEWYRALILQMREEGLDKSGHLSSLKKIADRMNELHLEQIRSASDSEYLEAFQKARKNIEALRMRSGHSDEHDIQVSLNGIYGLLILKLQKRDISDETEKAFRTISALLALLSLKYMEQIKS